MKTVSRWFWYGLHCSFFIEDVSAIYRNRNVIFSFLFWILESLFSISFNFFLFHADSLVPVVTVQLGEPVTLTCALSDERQSIEKLQWYKQSAGDTLKSIVMLWKNLNPTYGPGFSASKLMATHNEKNSTLTIFRTSEEDEGMYHCAIFAYGGDSWSGTYLSLKGNCVIYVFQFFGITLKYMCSQLHCNRKCYSRLYKY